MYAFIILFVLQGRHAGKLEIDLVSRQTLSFLFLPSHFSLYLLYRSKDKQALHSLGLKAGISIYYIKTSQKKFKI